MTVAHRLALASALAPGALVIALSTCGPASADDAQAGSEASPASGSDASGVSGGRRSLEAASEGSPPRSATGSRPERSTPKKPSRHVGSRDETSSQEAGSAASAGESTSSDSHDDIGNDGSESAEAPETAPSGEVEPDNPVDQPRPIPVVTDAAEDTASQPSSEGQANPTVVPVTDSVSADIPDRPDNSQAPPPEVAAVRGVEKKRTPEASVSAIAGGLPDSTEPDVDEAGKGEIGKVAVDAVAATAPAFMTTTVSTVSVAPRIATMAERPFNYVVQRLIVVALTLVQAATEAVGRFVGGLFGYSPPARSQSVGIGNPLIPTSTDADGKITGAADPHITYHDGLYYATYTSWDQIEIRSAPSLALLSIANPHVVFPSTETTPPDDQVANIWAPELHLLDGPNGKRWYLYYSAESKESVLFTGHRMFVLESQSDSPVGPYAPAGIRLDTRTSSMTIDGTVYQAPDGRQYLFFGATPEGSFGTENIYVQELENPWTTKGDPVLVAAPTYSWEKRGTAINEAPQILVQGDRLNIVYSAGAYFFPAGYSLGLLSIGADADLLNPQTWVGAKRPEPLFTTNPAAGVWGPGHNSFFSSPDGTETWFVYHAYSGPLQGLLAGQYLFGESANEYRTARVQQVSFATDNTPVLGVPEGLSEPVPAPSGDPGLTIQAEGLEVVTNRAVTTSLSGKSFVGQSGTRVLLAAGGSATLTASTLPSGDYDVYLRQRPSAYSGTLTATVNDGVATVFNGDQPGVYLGSAATSDGTLRVALSASELAIIDLDEIIVVRR